MANEDPWESPCYIGGGNLGGEVPAQSKHEPFKTYQDYLKFFEIEIRGIDVVEASENAILSASVRT